MNLDAEHLRSLGTAMNMMAKDWPNVVDDLWKIHQTLLGLMAEEALKARESSTPEGPTPTLQAE